MNVIRIAIDDTILIVGPELIDILDAAGIAPGPDVVGRVREVVGQISAITAVMRGRRELGDTLADRVAAVIACADARGVVLGKCDAATSGVGVPVFGQAHDRVQWLAVRYSDALIERDDLSRRLDASEHDRVGLLAKLEALRGERNSRSLAIQQCHTALTKAGVRQGDVVDRLGALIAERDALRAPKVAAVEWDGLALRAGRKFVSSVNHSTGRPGEWFVYIPDCPNRWATSKESAMRLAELLANHDPGGVWRVNGDVVSPDTVRMICPSVAVTWGES